MSRRRVDVRIDALVLRGVAPRDRDGIAAGLRAELGRLVADSAAGGAFAQERSTSALRLGDARVASGTSSDRIGRHAARRVAEGMVR